MYLANKGGYRVLLPDLYKGKVGVDAEEASHVRLSHRDMFCLKRSSKHAVWCACTNLDEP